MPSLENLVLAESKRLRRKGTLLAYFLKPLFSMAPKRASPLDEPPTASSSSEEEEASSEEVGSSSEEEEEDDEPAKAPSPLPAVAAEKKPTAKKPPPAAPTTKPQPKASVSESETESDSGSDSENERPSGNTDLMVKPIASKPMEETPKAKKPKSQPSVTPATSATKRPSENNRPLSDSKRAKKKGKDAAGDDEIPAAEDDGKKAVDESKKMFQRLWSEDDEIAILLGLSEYAAKTGAIPHKDINAFHDFIKKSVRVDVSKEQLSNKIRTLKKKYQKNAGKSKNGEDPRFSKPHEKKVYELSKKIWATEGANGGIDLTKSNGKDKKNQKEGSSTVPSRKPKAKLDSKEARKIDIDQNAGSPLSLSEMIRFNRSLGLSGLDDDAIKGGYELVGASTKAELEDRWKKLQVAELELFVKRVELVKDEASLIWEAYKSSDK